MASQPKFFEKLSFYKAKAPEQPPAAPKSIFKFWGTEES